MVQSVPLLLAAAGLADTGPMVLVVVELLAVLEAPDWTVTAVVVAVVLVVVLAAVAVPQLGHR